MTNRKLSKRTIDTSNIQIEKDVEIQKTDRGRLGKWSVLFVKMNIGDSFAVQFENKEDATRIQQKINLGD